MSDLYNHPAAITELKALSRDARLHLQDRIGNNLHVIKMANTMKRPDMIDKAIEKLMADMREIGVWE